jgi:hypothetical protein
MLPYHLSPWQAVYQQTQRWVANSMFAKIGDDLRVLLWQAERCNARSHRAGYQ